MDKSDLIAKLNQPEDLWVERKESFHEREVRKTLVAFANSVPEGESAVLFIGASNSGKHPGVADADGLQPKVLAQAQQNSYPEITVQLKVLNVGGCPQPILAVIVPASRNKPHFGGVAWVREGSESKRASEQVFKELVASQNDKVRRLQSHGNNHIVLKLKSSPTEFILEHWQCKVSELDAHHIKIHDTNGGNIYSFPINNISITDIDFGRITIEAPWPYTEPGMIRKLALDWSTGNEPNIKSIQASPSGGHLKQLLDHPEIARPIIASESDKSHNPNLRLLLASLNWELKKRSTPRSPEDKRRFIEEQMKRIQESAPAALKLYPRHNHPFAHKYGEELVNAVSEVSTSLDDADRWLNAFAPLFLQNPSDLMLPLYRKFNLHHILGY